MRAACCASAAILASSRVVAASCCALRKVASAVRSASARSPASRTSLRTTRFSRSTKGPGCAGAAAAALTGKEFGFWPSAMMPLLAFLLCFAQYLIQAFNCAYSRYDAWLQRRKEVALKVAADSVVPLRLRFVPVHLQFLSAVPKLGLAVMKVHGAGSPAGGSTGSTISSWGEASSTVSFGDTFGGAAGVVMLDCEVAVGPVQRSISGCSSSRYAMTCS